jgi:hypothetical protein
MWRQPGTCSTSSKPHTATQPNLDGGESPQPITENIMYTPDEMRDQVADELRELHKLSPDFNLKRAVMNAQDLDDNELDCMGTTDAADMCVSLAGIR